MADKKKSLVKDLKDKSVKELVQTRTKLKQELHGLKMKHAIKWLKQTDQIKKTRKNVARVNTLLTSKIKEKYGNSMK